MAAAKSEQLGRNATSLKIVTDLRNAFLTMDPLFLEDARALSLVERFIPQDKTLKIPNKGDVEYTETKVMTLRYTLGIACELELLQDLQDVFYPKFAEGLTQSERERLGDVWDWNKHAIRNHQKIPRPKIQEHTLLMMMQARCFIVVSHRAGVGYWLGVCRFRRQNNGSIACDS